jgi:outer membrane murein-binding lipoprotein Lpp
VRFVRNFPVKTLNERVSELEDNIPTKLSQLENDVPYVPGEVYSQGINQLGNNLSSNINGISSKVSQLSDKVGSHDTTLNSLDSAVQQIGGVLDDKADKTEIPTKVSQLENDSKYLNWQTIEQEIETARSIIGNCSLIEVDSQPSDLPINNEILLDTNNNILYIGIKNKMWWVIDNLKPFNPLIPDAKVIGTTLDV